MWRAIPHLDLMHTVRLASQADVIVAGREIGKGLLAVNRAARILRRRYAVTVQSNVDAALAHFTRGARRRQTVDALREAGVAVCVSEGAGRALAEVVDNSSGIRVVLNGVDVLNVREQAERTPAIPLPGGPLVIGVGRLDKSKGFDLLIRAHAQALAKGAPPHTLLLLGEGGDRPALEQLVESLGVESSVRMPGFVPNPHAVVSRADLFVLSSRWEGFGLTLVETLSLGVPSVAADCMSGPREILSGGEFGHLVPVEDVGTLTSAITDHLLEPQDLRERATRGSATTEVRFDPDSAARQHLDILKEFFRSIR